jgi:hypothetical protein
MHSRAQNISVGDVLNAWIAALSPHGSVCLLAGGLVTSLGILSDLTLGERGGQLVLGIATFFIQYHLVEYVLVRDFGKPHGGRHYGSAFGAALLSTLGAGLAMLLLILPGIYVAARWSLSNALVIGEGLTTTGSLRESWRRTDGSVWPIVVCYVLLGAVLIGGAIGLSLIGQLAGPAVIGETFATTLAGNVLGGCVTVGADMLTCALYGLIGQQTGMLDDVFG